MALRALASASGILLGWTDPRPYDAGTIDGVAYPAGRSFRVCIGTEAHDFTVLKVKSADVDSVLVALGACARGTEVTVEFEQTGSGPILRKLRALAAAGKS